MDLYSDVDVDMEFEESSYDYIHAGYDIHDPDIVRTLTIIKRVGLLTAKLYGTVDSNARQFKQTARRRRR